MQAMWDEAFEIVKETEMRARIQGVSEKFLFGAKLSKTQQKVNISAAKGQKVREMVADRLSLSVMIKCMI